MYVHIYIIGACARGGAGCAPQSRTGPRHNIYVCMNIYMYMYKYIYIYTSKYTYIYICIYTYIYHSSLLSGGGRAARCKAEQVLENPLSESYLPLMA